MKACTANECGRPVRARGYCNTHYSRWRATGTVDDPERRSRLCTLTDCGLPHYARGLCNTHYERLRRTGTADDPVYLDTCTADGCDGTHVARGLCDKHYRRLRTHGDPLYERDPRDVTYYGAHHRVRSRRGRASEQQCLHCDGAAEDWAYDHQDNEVLIDPRGLEYSADPSHYIPLCTSCHVQFDRTHKASLTASAA